MRRVGQSGFEFRAGVKNRSPGKIQSPVQARGCNVFCGIADGGRGDWNASPAVMQIHRSNPFQAALAAPPTPKATGPSASTPAATPASASTPAACDPPSFLANFHSAMASGPSTPAASTSPAGVPAMPAATYNGSSSYFDAPAVDARTAAANAMLAAVGNNDVKGYQQAAANFLAASPAGSGLPIWASTITMDQHGNLINTNNAGIATDGTLVAEDRMGYSGMMSPVPGVPNIASGTANYLGMVTGSAKT